MGFEICVSNRFPGDAVAAGSSAVSFLFFA